MPLWTAPELNLGAMGWGVTLGSDKIGLKTPLGSASVTNDWLNATQNVSVMMEKSIGPVSGGVGIQQTTIWGINGVTTTTQPTGKATVLGQSVGTWMEGGPANKK